MIKLLKWFVIWTCELLFIRVMLKSRGKYEVSVVEIDCHMPNPFEFNYTDRKESRCEPHIYKASTYKVAIDIYNKATTEPLVPWDSVKLSHLSWNGKRKEIMSISW